MPQLEHLLQEKVIHSIRSDGSKLIAVQAESDTASPIWETFLIEKDGHIANDGTIILASNEKAVLRKTVTNEQLKGTAMLHDFVAWQSGFLGDHDDEESLAFQDQLRQAEDRLQEAITQRTTVEKQLQEAQKKLKEASSTTRRKEKSDRRMDLEEVEQRIKSTAAAIAERTPSHTQKIIANQVELSAGYYEEVGTQSHESFRLSLWLTVAGGVIFFCTALATVLISFQRGDTTLLIIIGSCASAITELLASLNRFYNLASQQLATFQTYLDRINRSSICYSMISEEAFEHKTEKQQEVIQNIITSLLAEK